MFQIKNDQLLVSIQPEGVELASVTDLASSREYMWQADPEIWGSHAPVLFPIIGGLKDDQYHFQDKTYRLPKHGFVRRNSNLRCIEQSEDSVTFELSSNPALRLVYPFSFSFRLTYRLEERQLFQEHLVVNEGSEPMYFSVGGHPAFRVPHFAGDAYTDHYLAFPQEEDSVSYTVNEAGLIGPETRSVPWQGNRLPLTHELFERDALVFKDLKSRSVTLMSKQAGNILTVDYPDFDFLGIWAKPNGDFVCIEPWLGIADNYDTNGQLTTKEGIIELAGQSVYGASFSIEFH
jgi:galactose mutarotase-like enzyme